MQPTAITAKLFKNGNSQAVRLPKEFRFEGEEVYIKKVGKKVILEPKPTREEWLRKVRKFFESPVVVSDDFMADRRDVPPQKRKIF